MAHVLTVDDLLTKMMEAPFPVPLFAYGTLRPGEALEGIVRPLSHEEGKVYGFALRAYSQGAYPWMVRAKDGCVIGDLLWLDPDLRLLETVRMEMRAGYEVQVVNVYTDSMTEPVPALAFVAGFVPFGARKIASGDWKDR